MPDDNKPEASSHLTWLAWVLAVLFLAYPLSMGPAIRLAMQGHLDLSQTWSVYTPLIRLSAQCEPLDKALIDYVGLWVPAVVA